jgi:hypothetical protein
VKRRGGFREGDRVRLQDGRVGTVRGFRSDRLWIFGRAHRTAFVVVALVDGAVQARASELERIVDDGETCGRKAALACQDVDPVGDRCVCGPDARARVLRETELTLQQLAEKGWPVARDAKCDHGYYLARPPGTPDDIGCPHGCHKRIGELCG